LRSQLARPTLVSDTTKSAFDADRLSFLHRMYAAIAAFGGSGPSDSMTALISDGDAARRNVNAPGDNPPVGYPNRHCEYGGHTVIDDAADARPADRS